MFNAGFFIWKLLVKSWNRIYFDVKRVFHKVLAVGGVDRIMFDNFTPEMTKKAVEMVAGKYETESSGGITFDTLREYAECGVDFISVGALTHSVKGLDMSFKAC